MKVATGSAIWQWLAACVLCVVSLADPPTAHAKNYPAGKNPYGNADPETGKPFYGGLQYQSGLHGYAFNRRIGYQRAVQLADEVKSGQLPGGLGAQVKPQHHLVERHLTQPQELEPKKDRVGSDCRRDEDGEGIYQERCETHGFSLDDRPCDAARHRPVGVPHRRIVT